MYLCKLLRRFGIVMYVEVKVNIPVTVIIKLNYYSVLLKFGSRENVVESSNSTRQYIIKDIYYLKTALSNLITVTSVDFDALIHNVSLISD